MQHLLSILSTGDVHGAVTGGCAGLVRAAGLAGRLRASLGPDRVMLLDCGDMLHGSPYVYFWNHSCRPHPMATAVHYMHYDAIAPGNHDLEQGCRAYGAFRRQLGAVPVVGANVIDAVSGKPFFTPYTVKECGGLRVAVVGLVTPDVAQWVLPGKLDGLRFDNIADAANHWIEYIRRHERPDLIVGLCHAGTPEVEGLTGLDAVISGHDHRPVIQRTASGTWIVNAGAYCRQAVRMDVCRDGRDGALRIEPSLVSLDREECDSELQSLLQPHIEAVDEALGRVLTRNTAGLRLGDGRSGTGRLMQLVHRVLRRVTGARISLAAPPSAGAALPQGEVKVRDLFDLYRYDDLVVAVSLSGRELNKILEYCHRMSQAGIPVTASGITYTVTPLESRSVRVEIQCMDDGQEYNDDAYYEVAMIVYDAMQCVKSLVGAVRNVATDTDAVTSRIVRATAMDLRHYLIEELCASGLPGTDTTPGSR